MDRGTGPVFGVTQRGGSTTKQGTNATTFETLFKEESRHVLREFLQSENLTSLIQLTGIPEQLRAPHTISGSFLDRTSRGASEPARSLSYAYQIQPIGDGCCIAAAYQPHLRVNRRGEIEGLLALDVRMTIEASDRVTQSEIGIEETLWIPIRKGEPLKNIRGTVHPCQDGEHYIVQMSNHAPGTELLVRAVERSRDGRYIVFDGSLPTDLQSKPEQWDLSRQEAHVYALSDNGPGGAQPAPVYLDLRCGDSFDGRQITYQAGSAFHPARVVADEVRVLSPTPAVIPIVEGRPLTTAFGRRIISIHGPWHLTDERKFSGLLELSSGSGSGMLVLVHESHVVNEWNSFVVTPLQTIHAPGAHVAALVTLTPSVSIDRQQPHTPDIARTTYAKASVAVAPQSRTVPFVDGTMITTVALDASGQRAEIIEALKSGRDGRLLPLEVRGGAVWTGTLLLKAPFDNRTWLATIQEGRIATTDQHLNANVP